MLNFENIKTVAYLGPKASFTEMAKDGLCEKFKINAFENPLETIREVTEYVDNNPDTLGILPIENSIEGTVRETIDGLINTHNPNIKILAEYYMPVNYCLLSRTTEFYSLSGVIASPDTLAKCKKFIKNDMPYNISITESASMAEAARSLQGYNLTYSSIGNSKIAEIYNLNILKDNINDDKTNQTRFILFGDFETEETSSDKTSIVFSPEHKPGGLLNILNIFLKNNVNLSYIASQTPNKQFGEYRVTVSFDGHIHNPDIFKTIREVKEKSIHMRFLGSYKKGKPHLLN